MIVQTSKLVYALSKTGLDKFVTRGCDYGK